MTKLTASRVGTQKDVERSVPELRLPDSESTAAVVVTQALEFCAQKMRLAGHQAVVDHLRQGDADACRYCHYSIAKQVAESLGALDGTIKAVYTVDYDATPEDICFGEGHQASLVHLIVWAERKTKALGSLVSALDRALVRRYAEVTDMHRLAHLLDVQVVDDSDVANRVGYGAMLGSLYNRPIRVWKR
jgi:hypothetical protein